MTITCTLRPKAKGTFTISPASVHVKGKTYKSKAVKIRVAGNAQGNGNRASSSQDDKTEEENAMRSARTGLSQKDLYITADLQKATVYEQEAVRLKYHVLALPGVGLSNTGLNEKPDFKNIVSLDIPTNPEFTLAHVNGVAYNNKAKHQSLKEIWTGMCSPLPPWLPLWAPINIISEIAIPISLSLRLFANVLSGTVIMALVYGLLGVIATAWPAALHVYFDLFSGAIQTYVFCMLTMTYVSQACGED